VACGIFVFLTLLALDDTSPLVSYVQTFIKDVVKSRFLSESPNFWHQAAAISIDDGLIFTISLLCMILSFTALAYLPYKGRPLIDRFWAIFPNILDDHFLDIDKDHLHFVNGRLSFQGRDTALQEMVKRIRTSEINKYITISGGQGTGKTRLGIELIRSMRKAGWDAGFLKIDVCPERLAGYRFRRKTLVFIDAADMRTDLWEMVTTLLSRDPLVIIVIAGQCITRPPAFDPDNCEVSVIFRLIHECTLQKLPYKALKLISPNASLEELQLSDGNPGVLVSMMEEGTDIRFYARQTFTLAKHLNALDLLTLSVFCGPLRYSDLPDELIRRKPLAALCLIFRDTPAKILDGTIPAIQSSLMADEIAFRLLQDMDEEDLRHLVASHIKINPNALHARISNLLKSRWPSEKRMATAEKLSLILMEMAPQISAELESEANQIATTLNEATHLADVRGIARRVEELWFASPDNEKLFQIYAESVPKLQDKLTTLGLVDDAREVFQRFYEHTRSEYLPPLKQSNEYRRIAMASLLTSYKSKSDDALSKTLYIRCHEELELALNDVTVGNAASTMQLFLAMMFDAGQRKNEGELEKLTSLVMDFMKHPACGASVQVHRLFFEIARAASTFYARLDRPGLIEAWLDRAKQINRTFNSAVDIQVLMAEAHMAMELMLTNASLGKVADMEEAAKQFRSLAARIPIQNRKALEPSWATMASAAITCYREIGRITDVERWAKNLMSMPTEKALTVRQQEKNQADIMLSEVRMIDTVIETFLENDHPHAAEQWSLNMAEVMNRIPGHECGECIQIQMRTTLRMINYYARKDFSKLPVWGGRLTLIMEKPVSKWNPKIAIIAMEAAKTLITAAMVHSRQDMVLKWQDTADAIYVRFSSRQDVRKIYDKIKSNRILIKP
jgi:hypothetical protein